MIHWYIIAPSSKRGTSNGIGTQDWQSRRQARWPPPTILPLRPHNYFYALQLPSNISRGPKTKRRKTNAFEFCIFTASLNRKILKAHSFIFQNLVKTNVMYLPQIKSSGPIRCKLKRTIAGKTGTKTLVALESYLCCTCPTKMLNR